MRPRPRFLSVAHNERYQHYGTRRNPPWIKLYREFLTDYELCQLSVASRLFFACCFILASEGTNKIPFDLAYLSKRVGFDVSESIVTPLIDCGMLLASGASRVLASSESRSTLLLSSSLSSPNQDLKTPDLQSNSHTKKKGNGKRPWSDDLQPSEKHHRLAKEWGVDLGFEWGKFKNYCLSHGKGYVDYEATFRNWLAGAYERKGKHHAL